MIIISTSRIQIAQIDNVRADRALIDDTKTEAASDRCAPSIVCVDSTGIYVLNIFKYVRKMLEFKHDRGVKHSDQYWFGKKSVVFHSATYSHLVTTGYVYDPRLNAVAAYNCAVKSGDVAAQCSTTLTPNGVILTDRSDVYTQDFRNHITVQPQHYARLPNTDRAYRLYSYEKDLYAFEDRSRELYVLKSDQSPPRSWSPLPSMIHKRVAPYVAITNTHIYAFAGKYDSSNDGYKEGVEHEVFDMETRRWSIVYATDRNDKITRIQLPAALHSYAFHQQANRVFYFRKNCLLQMVLDADHLYVSVRTRSVDKLGKPGGMKLSLTLCTNTKSRAVKQIKTCILKK